MKNSLQILLFLLFIAASCGKDGEPSPILKPDISGVSISQVKFHNALLQAKIGGISDGVICGFELAEVGSINKIEYVAKPQEDIISKELSDLTENTEYACRAFADNGNNIRIYGEGTTFKTEKLPGPSEIIPIEDEVLKKWLVVRYDTDMDQEISYSEALQVKSIDLRSDNVLSIKGIQYFTNLESMDISGSFDEEGGWNGKLTETDFSQNIKLHYFKIDNNNIRHVDLRGLKEINHASFSRNPIEEISFADNKKLQIIGGTKTHIRTCDLSGLDELDEVHLDENMYLESVVLDNEKLRYLDLHSSALKSLDVSRCPILNILSTLDNPGLDVIYISRAQAISTITKDSHTKIEYVD